MRKQPKPTPDAIKRTMKGMEALRQEKEKELRIIDSAIRKIRQECPHQMVKDDRCDMAVCSICGSQFGWYCESSPVHHCEYEMSEDCTHCGLSEERK